MMKFAASDDVNIPSGESLQCDICDIQPKSKTDLNNHITKIHNVQAPKQLQTVFSCSLCDNHFKINHEYKEHIVKHLEEIGSMDLKLRNENLWVEYVEHTFA